MTHTNIDRPKIGLALGGAAARSVFYIGLLESFTEHDIPIDFISACSSGTIVAAAFACGNLEKLKREVLHMDRQFLLKLLHRKNVRSGIYSLDKVEEVIREFTDGKHFNQVQPVMAFMAVDIERGESVTLSMGDIARAARISCTVPGIFEPVRWGNRLLIDGGLLSVVPGDIARSAGMDIVIGVNTRGTKNIFPKKYIHLRKAYNLLKRTFLINHAEHFWEKVNNTWTENEFFEYYSEHPPVEFPGLFTVLGKSLDLAIQTQKNHSEDYKYDCDLMITIEREDYGVANFSKNETLYYLGRKTGAYYAPQIKQLIKAYAPASEVAFGEAEKRA